MKLGALVDAAAVAPQSALAAGWRGLQVVDVITDSRQAQPGALFVAIAGETVHGADFAARAVAAGAIAVVADRPVEVDAPVLIVSDARVAIGALASAFWGHPSQHLAVIAVTGTNGKTTTASLIAELLTHAGHRAASLGTLGIKMADGHEPGSLTTPVCADLHRMLARLVTAGMTHVAMEASSHALHQQRLAGVTIAAAIWTNLSRDHLDYHGDEAAYSAAKQRLFRELLPAGAPAFVNGDDPACITVAQLGLAERWSMGADGGAEHQVAGVRARRAGIALSLHSPERSPLELRAPLLGGYNAHNLVAAALVCRALGVDDKTLVAGAARLSAPAGRMQPIANDIGSAVLVDYAHTPDALAKTLAVAREQCSEDGRLLVVFGCGGDRDKGKRPLMGEAAARRADLLVLTSDNPRTEDPDAIIAAIEPGVVRAGAVRVPRLAPSNMAAVAGHTAYLIEPDRSFAIRRAIGSLQVGDVLVIAGKGHETTQTLATGTIAFDDAAIAAGWLKRHRRNGSGLFLRDAPEGPEAFAFDGPSALRATGGSLLVGGRASKSLCTDSREVVDDCVFVALSGERFDGNEYIGEVLDSGAAGIICGTDRGLPYIGTARAARSWLLECGDPLVALGDLARAHRQRFLRPVVGITGSNGKTTTKELTALCLRAAGPVLATEANHNNRIGVPLTLARLRAGQRHAVVEMGTSEHGEIAELARIVAPDIAVITNIAEAHLLGLGTVQAVAAEKSALLRSLSNTGTAIVPSDEPLLQPHISGLSCRVVRFGLDAAADVHPLGAVTVSGLSQSFVAHIIDVDVQVTLPGVGQHLVIDALAALAVARVLGVNMHAAARMLATYAPVGQRMKPTQIGPRLVLEDCYNANPRSTEVALGTLASLPGPRVAVLGDMLELGPTAAALHQQIGAAAVQQGIDTLIALGMHAEDYVAGAVKAGSKSAFVAVDVDDAVARINKASPHGGTVLIKGSRGARMERVVKALTHNTGESGPEARHVSLAV